MLILDAPQIRIGKDGVWYADGVPAVNKQIIQLFASHLQRDDHNHYTIEWQNQSYPVEVEDVPFFVVSLAFRGEEAGDPGEESGEESPGPVIRLYDGREMPLPPGKIVVKKGVPYISLLWPEDTKLSRAAYAELCTHAIERKGRYFIQYADKEWLVEEIP